MQNDESITVLLDTEVRNTEIEGMVKKAIHQLTSGWGYEGEKMRIVEYSYSFVAIVEIMPSRISMNDRDSITVMEQQLEGKCKSWSLSFYNRRVVFKFDFDKREIYNCSCRARDYDAIFGNEKHISKTVKNIDIYICQCGRQYFKDKIRGVVQYLGWGSLPKE